MGYYNIYRIIKDILRTILGKRLFRLLLIALVFLLCYFIFFSSSVFAYSLDDNQADIYTYESNLQEYAMTLLLRDYESGLAGNSSSWFNTSGRRDTFLTQLKQLAGVSNGSEHYSGYSIFVDWNVTTSLNRYGNYLTFSNSNTTENPFYDGASSLLVYFYCEPTIILAPSDDINYWHNINCGLAGIVDDSDSSNPGYVYTINLASLGVRGFTFKDIPSGSSGIVNTYNVINMPANLYFYRSPFLRDLLLPYVSSDSSSIDYTDTINNMSNNLQASIANQTTSINNTITQESQAIKDSIQDQTTQIVSSQQDTTNAVNNLNETTSDLNNYLHDDNIDDSTMEIDTSQYEIDDGGSSNFILQILQSVESTINGISSGDFFNVEIPLPNNTGSLNLSSDMISSHIEGTWVYTTIQLFWTFLFGVFFLFFAKRLTDFFSNGDFANSGLSGLIHKLDNENVVIKSTMM